MNARPILLALPLLLGAAGPALAQSQDGCIRLPSSSAMIIIIPKEGCGTQMVAAARRDAEPTVVYGTLPAKFATVSAVTYDLPGPTVIPYTDPGIAVIGNTVVHVLPKVYRPYRHSFQGKRPTKVRTTLGFSSGKRFR